MQVSGSFSVPRNADNNHAWSGIISLPRVGKMMHQESNSEKSGFKMYMEFVEGGEGMAQWGMGSLSTLSV